ncbi:hypothetical protein P691DRAFT_666961 [Macrolepiota fuliginosa MF-IS2]|uniref:Ubinuclein middle domain-containing protein n=1 Tax=Macrolepiota fuliginosa MF-IS2 TaxID=1400762 RepID=A0A9P6C5D5_9AGAR|nr:hypothetical protein P691DRAFT_666961 [Macrolepiota fuliginosa MF-IS2]
MNPEPVSDHDDSQHEESEVEAETHLAAEEYDDDEEEDGGSSGDDEEEDEEDSEGEGEEEGDDSTKDSILIAESHGPSTASTAVPEDSTAKTTKDSSASRSISIPVLIHPSPALNPNSNSSASPAADSGNPPSASAPPGLAVGASSPKPASSSAKPRSKKHRSPSPSPPPPPPPPPLTTIRLDIRLGGPENYEVDVSKLAKDSGQRPPTPPRITVNKHPISESEAETDGGKKKKRRKNPTSDYYDVNDPFIDDSELALDERTYFAQTKQQGFYVSSGEVALLKDKTPKKPKSKKMISLATAINAASASVVKPEGAQENGVGGDEDISARHNEEEGDERVGQKRKRYITVVENGKKRKVIDQSSFHPELQTAIEKLKDAIKSESWSQKGKFPPGLKPQLSQLALQAIKLDEYDEHFFSLMPALFPYNKFTMTKLIKRTVFADHTKLLHDRQEELLAELKALTEEGFQKAEEEWTKSVIAWDRRQEKTKVQDQTDSAAPTRHPTEEMEVDGASVGPGQHPEGSDGKEGAGKESKEAQPPQKRYRLTEQMKNIVWQLVLLSNECCRLENEKNGLEGSVIQVSEQGSRKNLYQKIVAQFPEGWMNSGHISREVSVMKKKYEKEAMDGEE